MFCEILLTCREFSDGRIQSIQIEQIGSIYKNGDELLIGGKSPYHSPSDKMDPLTSRADPRLQS